MSRFATGSRQLRVAMDVQTLLYSINQLDAWAWVLNFRPAVNERFCNPLRNDSNPRAYLYEHHGNILLSDFGCPELNGKTFIRALMFKYGIDLLEALGTIERDYIRKNNIRIDISPTRFLNQKANPHFNFSLSFVPGRWDHQDKEYFEQFEISRSNLEFENIQPVHMFRYNTRRNPNNFIVVEPFDVCFADVINGHKKIHRPYQKERHLKWVSDLRLHDIGGNVPLDITKPIFLKKSYKDYQVVVNQGYQARYTLNEGVPLPATFLSLLRQFPLVIALEDNDETGIAAAKSYEQQMRYAGVNGFGRTLPVELGNKGISDPADCIKTLGRNKLNYYLEEIVDSCRDTKFNLRIA